MCEAQKKIADNFIKTDFQSTLYSIIEFEKPKKGHR